MQTKTYTTETGAKKAAARAYRPAIVRLPNGRYAFRSFGWTDIIDLGDITTARGTEMMLPVWVRLFGALQKPLFNFKIVR